MRSKGEREGGKQREREWGENETERDRTDRTKVSSYTTNATQTERDSQGEKKTFSPKIRAIWHKKSEKEMKRYLRREAGERWDTYNT